MEGLSVAASGIAVVSVAFQLLEECIKLRDFWESVRDAPEEVGIIFDDLKILSALLEDIDRNGETSPAVTMGLISCKAKIKNLNRIIEGFDACFRSDSRRERWWGRFKATTRTKQLKDFRDSLNETKSTIMLAILWEIKSHTGTHYLHASTLSTPAESMGEGSLPPAYTPRVDKVTISISKEAKRRDWLSPTTLKNECQKAITPTPINDSSMTSNRVVRAFLQQSMRMAVDDLFESDTIEGLLEHTINNVTEFEAQSCGSYTSNDYEIHNGAKLYTDQACQNPFTSFTRASRVCHRTSSVGVLFGSIWVRTSTLRLATTSASPSRDFQITTSFIFYPSPWLTKIGLGQGVEASLQNSKGGWKFDFNPIRAVPDNSLIFELCKDGDVKGVQRLLRRNEASIKDTSSQGWAPLHFAAQAGHADLCDLLIKAGADKGALVFKGPTRDALSPITIFVATNHNLHAKKKIRMLELFSDQLELTDPSGDGWTVHAQLKHSYNKELVPIPQNSITWLLRTTASEEFIAFGPKTIWTAVQHSVRSFLVHEQNEGLLQRLLALNERQQKAVSQSHAASVAHWLALRASEKELLPMAIGAGRLCNITGFDWIEDHLTPSQFVKALPVIYRTWSVAFPNNVGHVEKSILSELESILERGQWSQEDFLAILCPGERSMVSRKRSSEVTKCSSCHDDYSSLGVGVVSPTWIAFLECTKTEHKFHWSCSSYLEENGVLPAPPPYTPCDYVSPFDNDDDICDEECAVEADIDIAPLCEDFVASQSNLLERYDPFTEAASLLYRAQGRTWQSSYRIGDHYCATCFLLSERYIGKDGLGTETDFPDIPESFMTWRLPEASCTFAKEH
ncbi:hypothetical protein GGR57DRAFT_515374 [Xylariaceae sp. FL1272]|nr:hypothetical protein GGR57DRAFT_515374 [Xylariaceae sp. FL1272]